MPTVFFDIGETLGTVTVTPRKHRIDELTLYPFVPDLLKRLGTQGVHLGIISNTGQNTGKVVNAVLKTAGILDAFDLEILVYSKDVGLKKDTTEIFELAVERAQEAARECVFVGEDARERMVALDAGLRVCPHPLLVEEVLADEPLHFVRVTQSAGGDPVAWRALLARARAVPLRAGGVNGEDVIAIASRRGARLIANAQLNVQFLGAINAPLTSDLFLLRDDIARRTGALSTEGQAQSFFRAEDETAWVLQASAEGVLVALPGDRSIDQYHFKEAQHGHTQKLMANPQLLSPFGPERFMRPARWLAEAFASPALSPDEKAVLAGIDGPRIRTHVDRYVALVSRHSRDAANAAAVTALVDDFRKIGDGALKVRLHPFTFEGRQLFNVSAELAGETDELVVISAHLDSTAAVSHSATSPAPGADDDGSGIAGVLAVAETFHMLGTVRKPERTIRFVMFNAEEQGLVGSAAYARAQAAASAPIVGVFQMDMIGYNVDPPRSWEVHAGFSSSPDVQARSVALADMIRLLAGEVSSALEAPQIYTSDGPGDEDPAEGRSDHASFHVHGYAACACTEDFFAGPTPGHPPHEPNPNYHKDTDTFVDEVYAADIARVVAAAAWTKANEAPPGV